MYIIAFWAGCNSQSASNTKLDRRALASEVKATTVAIFHELDTQEGQGVPVLWTETATDGIPDDVSVSS